MKLSKAHLKTLREVPTEAEIPSHILLLRTGMIRKLVSGVYGFMPMGRRTLRKIEKDTERDFFMGADEAVQYGLVDKTIDPKAKNKEGK